MSRVGKRPVILPQGVTIAVMDGRAAIKGPKGELGFAIPRGVHIDVAANEAVVRVENPETKAERSLWGTFRKHIADAIAGVTKGFEKKLELFGGGYKAAVSGVALTLDVGFSHPVVLRLPKGLKAVVEKNMLTLTGIDKQELGQFAANLRNVRPPEPYKGKGIKYSDEVIRRKAGKAAKAGVK